MIKIVKANHLLQILEKLRRKKFSIVFTNGCFDLLHPGHIKVLKTAKNLGDILVVGLNSDKSVKRLKGPARPICSQKDRALVLSALGCVDYVVVFNEDTPAELIKDIRPDILVKGGDWTKDQIAGREYAKRVVRVKPVQGKSSTDIIKKIVARSQ